MTERLSKVLTLLKGNQKAIHYLYGRLFKIRPDLKEQYYERLCQGKMYDKMIDLLLSEPTDSEIKAVCETHAKLKLTCTELHLYNTMFIDTAIEFCNKYLDRKTLRELYSASDSIINQMACTLKEIQ